jgi:hypothetical protein|tara:strand:- start:881 stop:1003 length:123 start_codon:yes stop_codon:yes gene_type:complete
MKDKMLDHNKKGKQMLFLNRWTKLIKGILALDEENFKEII